MSESATYLNGTISVKRRSDDYMAWRIGDTALWALGSSPREAIGNLVMTHPDEIIAAALAARTDRDAAALEAMQSHIDRTVAYYRMILPYLREISEDEPRFAWLVSNTESELAALAATDRTAPAERRGGEAT